MSHHFQTVRVSRWVRRIMGLVWLCAGVVVSAEGAVVQLKNGDRVSGVIQAVGANGLTVRTRWGADLEVPFSEIRQVEGEEVALPEPPAPAPAAPKPAAGKASQPVQPKKVKAWHGDLLLGANLTFSEKNQQLYTGRLKLTYVENGFRNVLDYQATYGQTEQSVTANRMDGTSKTDFDVGNRWYVYNLGRAGYDEIRKIDLRYELGPGAGYHLVQSKTIRLDVEVGSNYKVENRADGSGTELFVARAAEDATWTVSPRLTLEEHFEILPEIERWGTYRFRFEAGVKYAVMGNVSLNLHLINQYDTRPARSVQQNDLQVRSSLGVTF